MSAITEIETAVLQLAGKTDAQKATVHTTLLAVIDSINAELSAEVVKNRVENLSLSTSATNPYITLPDECRRVIEIGEYDSATDRIKYPWTEINERDWHLAMQGEGPLPPLDANSRYWMFVDRKNVTGGGQSASNALQIRVWPQGSTAIPTACRFFEALKESNIDRLENRALLQSGTIARLAGWFPTDQRTLEWKIYNEGLASLKLRKNSINPVVRRYQSAAERDQNALGSYLVG